MRRTTIAAYSWLFDSYSVIKVDCDNAEAAITLRDNKGNLNTWGTAFDGFSYGVVHTPGDTAWSGNRVFQFYLGRKTHNNSSSKRSLRQQASC
ncbi:MAG: hypothetical protein M3342_09755 [Bacteroidota bacterium]|nr:hypothetical protein [Bacteroidota bacterium]